MWQIWKKFFIVFSILTDFDFWWTKSVKSVHNDSCPKIFLDNLLAIFKGFVVNVLQCLCSKLYCVEVENLICSKEIDCDNSICIIKQFISPLDSSKHVKLTIYHRKLKTAHLIITNNTPIKSKLKMIDVQLSSTKLYLFS